MSVSPVGLRLARWARMLPSCVRLLLRRQDVADLLIERDQADRVLLMDHQVAERRGQADRVVELRQFLAIA